jgi:hypothetical protein
MHEVGKGHVYANGHVETHLVAERLWITASLGHHIMNTDSQRLDMHEVGEGHTYANGHVETHLVAERNVFFSAERVDSTLVRVMETLQLLCTRQHGIPRSRSTQLLRLEL